MPELPEVQTTANILNNLLPGLVISDIWTSYNSKFHTGKENIKNPLYFSKFKKAVIGKKIVSVGRRGKNVLINLSSNITILVHMKMTGHLLYGTYKRTNNQQLTTNNKEAWEAVEPEELKDPFNRFIRLVFTLSNGKHLAFSDMRKFAKVFYFPTKEMEFISDFKDMGPEPLLKNFGFEIFKKRLSKKPNGKIKQVLMDQTVISGIGNIYSDEILFESGVHPKSKVSAIPDKKLREIFNFTKSILKKGISLGGDSMSDYRNPYGKKGNFQNNHKAYRRTGGLCPQKECGGKIERLRVGGRNAHFCPKHQILY
ncbi:MAG: bifunctional DNA-formamidopyrimidine glycosylase/DNA-(apurinic or apyrimidinic site) lyase [Candidatus Paceibacterota bacterium]|jgi:formamidopyrimidine-DNA glycosylase